MLIIILQILLYTTILAVNIFIIVGIIGFFSGAKNGAPFIPTGKNTVNQMLDIAGNIKGKTVYDLGCGDGRLVFAASKKGAKAIGVEISRFVYGIANTRKLIGKHTGELKRKSLWDEDLSDADIIFLYLLPSMMKDFEKEKLSTLKKGCRIISHGFAFPNTQVAKTHTLPKGRILEYTI